jgi:serine/threonine protein kinase
MDPLVARWLAACVLAALARLHSAGVAHRDVAPENVGFDAEGAPRLLDLSFAIGGSVCEGRGDRSVAAASAGGVGDAATANSTDEWAPLIRALAALDCSCDCECVGAPAGIAGGSAAPRAATPSGISPAAYPPPPPSPPHIHFHRFHDIAASAVHAARILARCERVGGSSGASCAAAAAPGNSTAAPADCAADPTPSPAPAAAPPHPSRPRARSILGSPGFIAPEIEALMESGAGVHGGEGEAAVGEAARGASAPARRAEAHRTAPSSPRDASYDAFAADVWSAGAVLATLILGPRGAEEAAEAEEAEAAAAARAASPIPPTPGEPSSPGALPELGAWSSHAAALAVRWPAAADCLRSLLARDPSRRPDAARALAHPFFSERAPLEALAAPASPGEGSVDGDVNVAALAAPIDASSLLAGALAPPWLDSGGGGSGAGSARVDYSASRGAAASPALDGEGALLPCWSGVPLPPSLAGSAASPAEVEAEMDAETAALLVEFDAAAGLRPF